MTATKSPSPSPSPSSQFPRSRPDVQRRPLQPKNIIPSITPSYSKPYIKNSPSNFNKENNYNVGVVSSGVEVVDQSLAEELTAVRLRLERLRLDKEKTEEMLDERRRMLDLRMCEVWDRGEVQRELEIEVDRLFRLKQLRVACVSTSPIRSLREKALDKKNNEVQSESTKTEDSNGKLANESSTSESSNTSLECSFASTSASVSTSSSTATSRMTTMLSRLSLDSATSQGRT